MLEGVLVDQRLRVARAQHLEIAPAEHDRLLDEVELWQRLGQAVKAARLPRISPGDPRVTSVDVARAAGVSQSTVSLVLSGKSAGRISARTEEAVRRAAEELGYRPNMAARALRTGAARSVGLVVPGRHAPVLRAHDARRAGGRLVGRLRRRARRRAARPPARGARWRRCAPAPPTASSTSPSSRPSAGRAASGSSYRGRARGRPVGLARHRGRHRRRARAPDRARAPADRPARLARAVPDVPDPQGALAGGAGVGRRRARPPTLWAGSGFDFDDAARAARRAARRRRSADRDRLRRRHPRRRRVPRGARARPADPRGPLGRRVRRPAVRARAVAAADDRAAPTPSGWAPSPSRRSPR